jgi:anti-anti-sigma regulatory factor
VRAWGCLFELLQALGRRPAFDALALTFARRFEKSPPAWSAAVEGKPRAETTGGRAHVSLSGVLNAGVGEVLKQAMKLAATSTLVRMDLAKLTDADNNGATLLMRAIAALKRAKKEFVFGSPEHLAADPGGRSWWSANAPTRKCGCCCWNCISRHFIRKPSRRPR